MMGEIEKEIQRARKQLEVSQQGAPNTYWHGYDAGYLGALVAITPDLQAENEALKASNAELVAAFETIAAIASDYETGQRMNVDDTATVLEIARAAKAKP